MPNQNTEALDYDAYRVDSIRKQLEEDQYIVDIEQIADKIIDVEMALLGDK